MPLPPHPILFQALPVVPPPPFDWPTLVPKAILGANHDSGQGRVLNLDPSPMDMEPNYGEGGRGQINRGVVYSSTTRSPKKGGTLQLAPLVIHDEGGRPQLRRWRTSCNGIWEHRATRHHMPTPEPDPGSHWDLHHVAPLQCFLVTRIGGSRCIMWLRGWPSKGAGQEPFSERKMVWAAYRVPSGALLLEGCDAFVCARRSVSIQNDVAVLLVPFFFVRYF